MQIMNYDLRISPVNCLEVLKALFVESDGLIIFHIADMLARYGKLSFGQCERILKVGPAPQDLRSFFMKSDRVRGITAGTADETNCGLRWRRC